MHHAPSCQSPRLRVPRLLLRAGALVLVLALAIAVVACGTSSATGSGQGAPNASATPGTPGTPGTAALDACPTAQAPANPRPADVVVQLGGGAAQPPGRTVALRVGQTLQVELPATNRWRMAAADSGSILTQPPNNGWYDAHLKACVWQFTAVKAGSTSLSYSGMAICAPGSKCPAYVIAQSFGVTVQ